MSSNDRVYSMRGDFVDMQLGSSADRVSNIHPIKNDHFAGVIERSQHTKDQWYYRYTESKIRAQTYPLTLSFEFEDPDYGDPDWITEHFLDSASASRFYRSGAFRITNILVMDEDGETRDLEFPKHVGRFSTKAYSYSCMLNHWLLTAEVVYKTNHYLGGERGVRTGIYNFKAVADFVDFVQWNYSKIKYVYVLELYGDELRAGRVYGDKLRAVKIFHNDDGEEHYDLDIFGDLDSAPTHVTKMSVGWSHVTGHEERGVS